MKNIIAFAFSLVIIASSYAQAPQKFNYQGAARDLNGAIYANTTLGLRISILQGGVSGTAVYSEIHTTQTNIAGVFNVQIGGGNVQSGNFSTINWGNGTYFAKVEIDATGGSNYSLLSSTQLLSVPYALHANSVDAVDWTDINNIPSNIADGDSDVLATLNCSNGQVPMYNGSSWTCGNISAPTQISVYEKYSTGALTLNSVSASYTNIPGMTQTITLTVPSKVVLTSNGSLQLVGGGQFYAAASIGVSVNNIYTNNGGQVVSVSNTTSLGGFLSNWSFTRTYDLAAGTYTFNMGAKLLDATIGLSVAGSSDQGKGVMNFLVIPN